MENDVMKESWTKDKNNGDKQDTTPNFKDVIVANYHHSLLPPNFTGSNRLSTCRPADKQNNQA